MNRARMLMIEAIAREMLDLPKPRPRLTSVGAVPDEILTVAVTLTPPSVKTWTGPRPGERLRAKAELPDKKAG